GSQSVLGAIPEDRLPPAATASIEVDVAFFDDPGDRKADQVDGARLMPPLDDRFNARRGTYRIMYRIDDKTRTVTVVDVDHRRDVYRT
ncbi:type II toxin-antitoxin system RelE family toxin, partial [Planosporangium flavigriseum]